MPLVAALGVAGSGPALAAGTGPCPIPAATLEDVPPLPALSALIHAGGKVTILAVGTASTNAATPSYPNAMLDALRARFANTSFDLVIKGARGMTSADLVPLIKEGIAAHHPALIIWQTGTVDAVRAVHPADMREAVDEGAALADDAHADLILVDPQYSRFLIDNTDLRPYEDILQAAALSLPGVALFPRFALMQDWAETGALDLEAASPAQRPQVAAQLHTCVGQALARFIEASLSHASGGHGAG